MVESVQYFRSKRPWSFSVTLSIVVAVALAVLLTGAVKLGCKTEVMCGLKRPFAAALVAMGSTLLMVTTPLFWRIFCKRSTVDYSFQRDNENYRLITTRFRRQIRSETNLRTLGDYAVKDERGGYSDIDVFVQLEHINRTCFDALVRIVITNSQLTDHAIAMAIINTMADNTIYQE